MQRRSLLIVGTVVLAALLSACSLFGPKTQDITGTVTFEKAGTALADAEVVVGNTSAKTDANGRFTLKAVAEGDHTLRVRFAGITVHEQSVKVTKSPQTLAVKVKPFLSGTVKYTSQEPAPGVQVQLADAVALTNDDGFYVLAAVPEGEQQVKAISSSLEYTQQVNVSGAHTTGVNFTVPVPENIALGKPVDASSSFGTRYPPEYAVDGDWSSNTSRWLTADSAPPPHWLEIDLQGTFGLDGARVLTGHYGSNNQVVSPVPEFKFQYWQDGAWVDIPGSAVQDNEDVDVTVKFTAPVITSKVRFYSDAPGSTVDGVTTNRIREIMVFGVPVS